MSAGWDTLDATVKATTFGSALHNEFALRKQGQGSPHANNDLRLFGTTGEPRLTFYKDSASWCVYCFKCFLLLEEKQIPYKVEKINMRSYGDKPESFLRLVPNGILPAIRIDNGPVQLDSVPIMMTIDKTFSGPAHKPMWPTNAQDQQRATRLMGLERTLFGDWCNLVFRGSSGNSAQRRFEQTMDEVNRELEVTPSPWFLADISIVDLQYVSHIERMCASCVFWSGLRIRGTRWPAIERWLQAFEARPSYMAIKSDYYTDALDIPPQYGPGYTVPNSPAQEWQRTILGEDGSWDLPLKPLSASDLEPVVSYAGEEAAKIEAAYKLVINHANIVKFACRGPGKPGRKQFQAPLADPYATPDLSYESEVDGYLRLATEALVGDYTSLTVHKAAAEKREGIQLSLIYLRDRIGVPRDMSYPAARQLRAHLNWLIKGC